MNEQVVMTNRSDVKDMNPVHGARFVAGSHGTIGIPDQRNWLNSDLQVSV